MIKDTVHSIVCGFSIKSTLHVCSANLNKLSAAVVERMVTQNITMKFGLFASHDVTETS